MNTWKKRIVAVVATVSMLPAAIASANETPIDEFVESYVAEHMATADVPGMVFVRVDAAGATIQSFGSADLSTGRLMTPSTPLRVGSIAKPVTSVIALELAASGVLDLDVPVDRYLDADLADAHGSASTIRQLLQHRGGYPDSIVGSHHFEPLDGVDLDEWVTAIPDRSISPDVVASYSSVGYALAGAGIAAATGEEFADVADRVLFQAIDMSSSTFSQPPPAAVATGYAMTEVGLAPRRLDTADLSPGVGLTASADDIAAFIDALVSVDSPLAPTTVRAILEPAGPRPGLRGFTTGLTEWQYGDRTVLYHEGNGLGTTARMMILPDERVGFFTAVNAEALSGMGDPSNQTRFIRDLHREIIETFHSEPNDLADAPTQHGSGTPTPAVPGMYVPTRVDPDSPLRLEALVSQSEVARTASGISFNGTPYVSEGSGAFRSANGGVQFLEGSDGVVYATLGGTGSFRQAAWWEALALNLSVLGGSVIVMAAGTIAAVRNSPRRIGWLSIAVSGLAFAYLGLLGYGVATVDVMELFTGLSFEIVLAQAAAVGMGAASLLVSISAVLRRGRFSVRTMLPGLAVGMAGLILTVWSIAWGVLPM